MIPEQCGRKHMKLSKEVILDIRIINDFFHSLYLALHYIFWKNKTRKRFEIPNICIKSHKCLCPLTI